MSDITEYELSQNSKRKLIRKLLNVSCDYVEEVKNTDESKKIMWMIEMKKNEYNIDHPWCFTLTFSDKKEDLKEAFCFNLAHMERNQVVAPNVFGVDVSVMIPLTKPRWRYLMKNYPEDMAKVSNAEYTYLNYPLHLIKEFTKILEGINDKSKPIVCTNEQDCFPIDVKDMEKMFTNFERVWIENVFDFTKLQESDANFVDQGLMEEKLNLLQIRIRTYLERLDIDKRVIDHFMPKLTFDLRKNMIEDMPDSRNVQYNIEAFIKLMRKHNSKNSREKK